MTATPITQPISDEQPLQRIVKVRRDYNTWVANETMEDYALRFTARSSRKWSEFRVANTAFGAISFLALEAIGGAVMVSYGFANAFWAIVAVSGLIFLTGLPIAWYAAKYGVDMDLLTRGAGFGYIGSTITSLIYATFTFIFFALEATILSQALKFCFGLPLIWGYLVSVVVIIPLVMHGITLISRLQAWTQPLWLVLMFLPFAFIIGRNPEVISQLPSFAGFSGEGGRFNVLLFGAACSVLLSMVAQIGEQIDFLRFMPEATTRNRRRWTASVLIAGPGWIALGSLKMLGGALLAFVAMQHEIEPMHALEPTEMYRVGFSYVFGSPKLVLIATALFVVLSQIKINVTNAYAGSLAWSNFFARLTHSHPGRVVWLLFNVAIALTLMALDVFRLLEDVLALYSNVAISWVGALFADLVINKPLGLSPKGIEFKRAHLYDINPVGVGAMLIASVFSILAFSGAFGDTARAFSAFIALLTALACAPAIAWLTGGRYYIARSSPPATEREQKCSVCERVYEREDMALCPAYRGPICSLCCSLDARCHDYCKPGANLSAQVGAAMRWLLPRPISSHLNTRLGHYCLLLLVVGGVLATIVAAMYVQEVSLLDPLLGQASAPLRDMSVKTFVAVLMAGGIVCWWLVLTAESRHVAQEESNRQTQLLMQEIEAHRKTDRELQAAKLIAERANLAKSRYITGVSHELRTPLNSLLGYAQMLERDSVSLGQRRLALSVIRRSGDHLVSLIDGLLDIASIESGKLRLETGEIRLTEYLPTLAELMKPQAQAKKITFALEIGERVPEVVRGDGKRIGQILINLLGNAVKFTNRGTVRLKLEYRRDIALFEVHDTGTGLSADEMERIFQPFERGTNARRTIGTGLGLTIAKLLTDLMGGELTVTSQPGAGSVFRLRLFLPAVRNPKPRPVVPALQVNGYLGARRRILVVDNEAIDRQFLVDVLEPLGFELSEAESGIEALQRAPMFRPDLILLDLNMPGIDGRETFELLRRNGLSQAPVIIVSADAMARDEGQLDGALPFVVKPVNVYALLDLIGAQLGLAWTSREAAPA
jgi:signal transduction histidine kinase/CheY-like chemotaxis protein/purine-cytosine permease-like protein